MIIQINPPLPVYIADKGTGLAHFLIDYSCEFDIYWVVFMDDTGECWTVNNHDVRSQKNITMNRNFNNCS